MAGPMRGGPGGRPGGFQKPKNLKNTIKRLAKYLEKHKLLLFLVMLFVIFSTLGNVAGTYMLEPIIDDYITPLIGTNPSGADFLPLIKMLSVMACIYVVAALSSFAYRRIMLYVSQKTLNEIRGDLFNHMEDLPLKYFDTHTHGELMSRYTNDADTLREALSNGVVQLFSSTVSVVSTFIMMLVISPILTILLCLCLL